WEPVTQKVVKTDPATGVSYTENPVGMLRHPKVLVWFEPRPTLLNGATGPFQSTINVKNQFGFSKLVPQLADPTDDASAVPCTVGVGMGGFQQAPDQEQQSQADFNPMSLFVPPADGSGTFTAADTATLKARRDQLKTAGMRAEIHRTVVKQ